MENGDNWEFFVAYRVPGNGFIPFIMILKEKLLLFSFFIHEETAAQSVLLLAHTIVYRVQSWDWPRDCHTSKTILLTTNIILSPEGSSPCSKQRLGQRILWERLVGTWQCQAVISATDSYSPVPWAYPMTLFYQLGIVFCWWERRWESLWPNKLEVSLSCEENLEEGSLGQAGGLPGGIRSLSSFMFMFHHLQHQSVEW